jgi:hypothetical protein
MNKTKLNRRAAGRRGFVAREAFALVRALLRETDGRGPVWKEFEEALCELLGSAYDATEDQAHEAWLRRQLATLNPEGGNQ